MKQFNILILLVFSNWLSSEEIKSEDWLLWKKKETQLPFSSATTIYPPVTLYTENGVLRGSIAAPYALGGDNNQLINQFLISVTDGAGKTHFLRPKLESVGFVGDVGIGISSLSSNSFLDGDVLVQLYKFNNAENRQALLDRENRNKEKMKGVEKALASLNISKPILGQPWDINATTLDGHDLNKIVESSSYTIVQLYSPHCGFCKKAIPSNNELNKTSRISIVGMAGVEEIPDFEAHLEAHDVQYPFIAYEGEYAGSALSKAVDRQLFPTYFVLDSSKKVLGTFEGQAGLRLAQE